MRLCVRCGVLFEQTAGFLLIFWGEGNHRMGGVWYLIDWLAIGLTLF